MNQLILQFAYLQLLDLMTTVAFLIHGIEEANPVVRFVMVRAPDPLWGLCALKLGAIVLGLYCWRMRRTRLLSRMNLLFAVVVAWNVVAIIVGSGNGGSH